MLILVAPVFNEGSRIRDFVVDALRTGEALDGEFRLILVDDGSRDEGVRVMDELAREGRVEVLRHARNQGIAAAFTTGIRRALALCGDDDAIGIVESDGSNDLASLSAMLERLDRNTDVVIASRNIPGGEYVGFGPGRRFFSRFGNLLYRSLAPVAGVTDYTIFYRVYRARALRGLFRDGASPGFLFPDFSANSEIILRLARQGCGFAEVPHRYRYDRKASASKLRVAKTTWQSLRLIARDRSERRAQPDGRSSPGVALIVVLLTLIQVLLAGLAFENPSDILSDKPILSYDNFAHEMIVSYIARSYRSAGDLWAYVPDWLAGAHLTGFLEAQGPIVAVGVLTGFRNSAFWLQVLYFLFAALMPVALYRGFRNFGIGPQAAITATFAGFLYFVGYFPSFLGIVGDSASAVALYGSVFAFAMLWRLASSGGREGAFRLLLVLPLYVLTHKSTILIVIPVAAAIYLAYWREWRGRLILQSVVIAGAVFAVNAFWILRASSFAQFMTADASPFYKDAGLRQFVYDFFTTTAYFPPWEHRGMAGLAILRWAVTLAGLWGLWRIRRSGDTRLFFALAGAALYLALMAYASDVLPFLRELKPLRLVVPLNLILLAAAAIGVERAEILEGLERRFRHRYRALLAGGFAVLTLGFCFGSMFKIRLAMDAPLRTRYPDDIAALRSWIEKSTDTSGRILFEQWREMPDASMEPAHQLHAGALLPRGRLYANGFHPIIYSTFAFPDFVAGELMREPVAEMGDDRLGDYLRVYNVRWVIAWSRESRARLDRFPGVRRIDDIHGFRCYIVTREPDWFLAGSGTAEADVDVIRLRGVKADGGRVVLAFHAFPYLASDHARIARAVRAPGSSIDDPMGFIEIRDPPSDFEIRKSGDWR